MLLCCDACALLISPLCGCVVLGFAEVLLCGIVELEALEDVLLCAICSGEALDCGKFDAPLPAALQLLETWRTLVTLKVACD